MSKQSGHIEDELIVLVRDHIGLEGLEHVPIEWNHAAQTNRKVRRRQGGWEYGGCILIGDCESQL
jgi:hypothetical protein